jgi:hypothetical protein
LLHIDDLKATSPAKSTPPPYSLTKKSSSTAMTRSSIEYITSRLPITTSLIHLTYILSIPVFLPTSFPRETNTEHFTSLSFDRLFRQTALSPDTTFKLRSNMASRFPRVRTQSRFGGNLTGTLATSWSPTLMTEVRTSLSFSTWAESVPFPDACVGRILADCI